MLEQAKRYGKASPGIVVKIPASGVGMEVLEDCVAEGCNVASTISFSVAQVLAAGEAYERGKARAEEKGIRPGLGIAVVMVGRLDDYLRDVWKDSGTDLGEEDIRWAGLAVIKRAYGLFAERGYGCILMPAAARGAYHFTELAGARMIFSVAPKNAGQLAEQRGPFKEGIGNPVPEGSLNRLLALPEFRKAYEEDGMQPGEFIAFGPFNRTLTQFQLCGWSALEELDCNRQREKD